MKTVTHLEMTELEAGLALILEAPKDNGVLELIVCRPAEGERIVMEIGQLDTKVGLVGDNWQSKPSSSTPDGLAHPEKQINIMNSRSIALIAQDKERWKLAGDQLYINMDLGEENLPSGTQLKIGEAMLEVTPHPHNGCSKFVERFGLDAMKFVNSPVGKKYHLRGINAKVIKDGQISQGDKVQKV